MEERGGRALKAVQSRIQWLTKGYNPNPASKTPSTRGRLHPLRCQRQPPNLSTYGAFCDAWEFNLRNFDIHNHRYALESINFLSLNGLDFGSLRTHGIDSGLLAQRLVASRLVRSGSNVEWIIFSNAYGFGYLIKILIMGCPLSERREDFMHALTFFFDESLI
ncbi:hypothetical protein COCNU_07G002420 [Cocos nucifera]|uniref:Uncharacterized protein n=1 Tax=Cocos nucifera TaxID=13894 RepID=A0A8K0IDX4_COCNU|nr:hypothetical protein COCNU_07G002420 [Cocos nucifera]